MTPSWPARSRSCPRSGRPGTRGCGGSSGSPRPSNEARSAEPHRRTNTPSYRTALHPTHTARRGTKMVDILHQVGVKSSSVDDAFAALTTREGLSGWWDENTQGDGNVGGVLQFRFDAGAIDMKVIELQ